MCSSTQGADWWKTIDAEWAGSDVNNTEVDASDWYFANLNRQKSNNFNKVLGLLSYS